MDQLTIGVLLAVGFAFVITAIAVHLKLADERRRMLEDIV